MCAAWSLQVCPEGLNRCSVSKSTDPNLCLSLVWDFPSLVSNPFRVLSAFRGSYMSKPLLDKVFPFCSGNACVTLMISGGVKFPVQDVDFITIPSYKHCVLWHWQTAGRYWQLEKCAHGPKDQFSPLLSANKWVISISSDFCFTS